MSKEKERLVSVIVSARIEDSFSQFDAKALGEATITQALSDMFSSINVASLYTVIMGDIDTILENQDYSAALRLYNNKGLLPQVSNLFGFKADELIDFTKRLIASKNNQGIMKALGKTLPELEDFFTIPIRA